MILINQTPEPRHGNSASWHLVFSCP